MAKKNPFLLVSLNESQTKELAQVISNDTCRLILNHMAEKDETTETEISTDLNLPISTVHYNLQQLMKGNLVTVEEFHYSEKGRVVNHYKLANKYIIIAPKSTHGIKDKLRSIFPVIGIVGGVSFVWKFLSGSVFSLGASKAKYAIQPNAPILEAASSGASNIADAQNVASEVVAPIADAARSAAPAAYDAVQSAPGAAIQKSAAVGQVLTDSVNSTVQNCVPQIQYVPQEPLFYLHPAFWFFAGSIIALGLYIIIEKIREKRP